jgi:hypothetical protein
MLLPSLDLRTNREGVRSRRAFLLQAAAGFGALSFHQGLVAHAAELRRNDMACILLWMGGGPSQFETFDPKLGVPTGGPTRAIPTAVPGIHIAQDWEHTAKQMKEIALIRSMTSKEGEHGRAQYYVHTGYTPSPTVKHPAFGSIAVAELARSDFDLPSYVRINRRHPDIGAGLLGARFAPFDVESPLRLPRNVQLPRETQPARFQRRLDLTGELGEELAQSGAAGLVKEHRDILDRAARLMLSKDLKAFDLGQEKDAVRDRYGRNPFGQGCLLARRLVETGVTFVEVVSNHPKAPAAWDTHIDNFDVTKLLVDWVDPAYAALLSDLKERGRLEKTLVVWMGEFGRTPKINNRGKTGGRDHFPNAFCSALAGGGVKGGRVVGATTADGSAVAERPVTIPDLLCTLCQALKINPRKENKTSGGLPVRIVDGGKPVTELF